MPILRRPSLSDIAVDDAGRFEDDPPAPEESGSFAIPRRPTVEMSAVTAPRSQPGVTVSSVPPPNVLPSLVVPPPAPFAPSSPMGAPPRRETVRMVAVGAPSNDEAPPSGRMLDAVDFAGGGRVALELGAMPAGRAQALGRSTPLPRPKTPVTPISPVGSSDVLRRSEMLDPRRPGIFAFAGFGLPPETIAGAPAYAVRVLLRKRILRAGLAVARRQRSADVELYESALRTADQDSYAKGLIALSVAALFFIALVCIGVQVLS